MGNVVNVEFNCPYCSHEDRGTMDKDAEVIQAGDVWERTWSHLFEHQEKGARDYYTKHPRDAEEYIPHEEREQECPWCDWKEDHGAPGNHDLPEHSHYEHPAEVVVLAMEKATQLDKWEAADFHFHDIIDDVLKEVE